MSAMIGVVLSVFMSAGVLGADIPGQQQQKSATSRGSRAIAYAKQIDVRRLDPTLPKRPLDQWIRDSGAPPNATRWDVSDGCSQQYDVQTEPDALLCVQFTVVHGNAGIRGMIQVGTMRDGVTGEPRLLELWFGAGKQQEFKGFESAKNLSELPRLIKKLKQY
jgi:hypothetical protein